jgi:hypothetical protein
VSTPPVRLRLITSRALLGPVVVAVIAHLPWP